MPLTTTKYYPLSLLVYPSTGEQHCNGSTSRLTTSTRVKGGFETSEAFRLVFWEANIMYWLRAARKALSETKAFWSLHRNWAFFSVPASSVLLRTLWKGWSTVTDAKEIAVFLFFGYLFSWIGSFLINLLRAPALLDADRQIELNRLREQHSTEITGLRNTSAKEKGELQRKLVEPKIVPEIMKYELEEVARPASIIENFSPPNKDTIAKLAIRLKNEQRQSATIQQCDLSVQARSPGITYFSRNELIHDVQNYVQLKLDSPIEYAIPHSGWLFFRFERRKKEDLIAGELELSVTDGTGKVSTASKHIA